MEDVFNPILHVAENTLNVFGETPNIFTMQFVIQIINIFIQALRQYGPSDETREYKEIMLNMIYQTMEEANNAGMDDQTANALPQLDQKIQELQNVHAAIIGGRRRRHRRHTRKH